MSHQDDCPIADRSPGLVAGLGRQDTLTSQVMSNILTVEDITSLLPEHAMTSTAMYRVMDTFLLNHETANVVSSNLMVAWSRSKDSISLIRDLAAYDQRKKVHALPPDTKLPKAFAICLVKSSNCSTLLFGPKDACIALKHALSGLFNTVFLTENPPYNCWKAGDVS